MAEMLWVNVALIAAWLMLNGISSLSTDALTLSVGKNINDPDPYPIQRFDTRSTDRRSYLKLIVEIRDMLTDHQLDPMYGIPRLADGDFVPSTRRFLLVELINSNEDTITVALNTINLYLVGYRRTNEFHYFPDTAEGVDTLFPHLRHTALPFSSRYGSLEREAVERQYIPLGIAPLEQAIMDLQEFRRADLARAFIVIIQMLPEAIRFRYIDNFIGDIIRERIPEVPSGTMLSLENQWGALSLRIQGSVDGILNPPVLLTDRYGVQSSISTVTRRLARNIGILLFFTCNRPRPNANQLSLISTTPLHINGGGTNCTNISEPIIRLPIDKGAGHMEADEDTCYIGDPTVRIVGRNGLCADVKGGFYNNGDPIILWPCKSNEDVNQLWTFKTDGTIRSNGKCLTTYQNPVPGNYIMIFDCFGTTLDATKWDIWDNGTIINPSSSLVMSATTGNTGTELTLQENFYATSQGWLVTNNTEPTVTPIRNNGDMCLEASDYVSKISYYGCQSGEKRQSFALYPDGSIRPDKRRDDCLTADNSNSIVITAGCNGGAEQRWSFNRDYTITNLDTKLAMDAQNNIVSLTPVEPRESQEWYAWFL